MRLVNEAAKAIKLDSKYCRSLLPVRGEDFSKTDCGQVLIIAGLSGMIGAAYMASFAAFRCGAGLVRILTAESGISPIQCLLPEAICVSEDEAFGHLDSFDAVAIGPGMGVSDKTATLIRRVCKDFDGPIVIDADGLNTLAYEDFDLSDVIRDAKNVCLTPHRAEAARLIGCSASEINLENRIEFCRTISKKYSSICLLKGKNTCVTGFDGRLAINTTGNPGMATAGSGDVLTGMITAFAGQGLELFDATCLAAFLHGRAGDEAAWNLGQISMMARDIIDNISTAINDL